MQLKELNRRLPSSKTLEFGHFISSFVFISFESQRSSKVASVYYPNIIMADTLPQNADYLIIGGGTAGLVVASRLASDLPDQQVVVLESGPDRTADPRVQNPKVWPTLSGSELDWQFKIVPQVRSPCDSVCTYLKLTPLLSPRPA